MLIRQLNLTLRRFSPTIVLVIAGGVLAACLNITPLPAYVLGAALAFAQPFTERLAATGRELQRGDRARPAPSPSLLRPLALVVGLAALAAIGMWINLYFRF